MTVSRRTENIIRSQIKCQLSRKKRNVRSGGSVLTVGGEKLRDLKLGSLEKTSSRTRKIKQTYVSEKTQKAHSFITNTCGRETNTGYQIIGHNMLLCTESGAPAAASPEFRSVNRRRRASGPVRDKSVNTLPPPSVDCRDIFPIRHTPVACRAQAICNSPLSSPPAPPPPTTTPPRTMFDIF